MSKERAKLSKEELKEDEFVEWIMRAVDYVRERAQIFAAGAIALILFVLLVDYIIDSRKKAQEEAATELGKMLIAEGSGDVGQAMQIAQRLLGEYDGTPAAEQGTVLLANRYFLQGNYGEARRLYQKYLDEYGEVEELVFAAWSGLASCLEAEGRTGEAADKYQEYAAGHPGKVESALALMEAARCYRILGEPERRKELLERVAKEFPDLPIAARARSEIAML